MEVQPAGGLCRQAALQPDRGARRNFALRKDARGASARRQPDQRLAEGIEPGGAAR